MTALNNTQKKQVQQKLKAFGLKNNELIQKIILRMVEEKGEWSGISFEMAIPEKTISEFLINAFCFRETPEGDRYWRDLYHSWENGLDIYTAPTELTQADIQSILHILREELAMTTEDKEYSKSGAAYFWALSNKEEESTATNFTYFSAHNKTAKEMKQREKKLVALITKLKGM